MKARFFAASIQRTMIYAAAGLAFWLPSIVVHAIPERAFGESRLDSLILLLLPIGSSIVALKLVRDRFQQHSRPSTIALWMLFGIWFLGPLCTTIGASFSGGGLTQPHAWMMLLIGIPLFVPHTFIMSAYDGSLGALVITTFWFLIAALVTYLRSRRGVPEQAKQTQ